MATYRWTNLSRGGKEAGKPGRSYDSKKKKVVCAVQLTDEGKVRRFYSLKIKDFSSKSLVGIFDKHISAAAKITMMNGVDTDLSPRSIK
jgi:hypothetical protein